MKKILYLFFITLIYIPQIFAQQQKKIKSVQDTSSKTHQLNEVNIDGQKVRKLRKDTLSGTIKMQVPLLQMPQNIISISSSLIQQQGGLQLRDMARNASGVYFGYNSTPFDYSGAIEIRGFNASTTKNGMPSRLNGRGAALDDAAIIENVEFIKGPAGFLNAQGEPGGTVNIVTKTPREKLLNVEISGGSFNLFRASADIGSNVQRKGFSYRFNTAYQRQDSYLDFLKTSKYVIAPVLQYNFSPNTYVLGEYDYIRGEMKNGSSINKLRPENEALKDPISLNYAAALGLPLSVNQSHTFRFVAVHKFNPNWQLTSQSNYTKTPLSNWHMVSTNLGLAVGFDDKGKTLRRSTNSNIDNETYNTNLFLTGKFTTGVLKHNILIGSDYTNGKDVLSLFNGTNTFAFDKNNLNFSVDPTAVSQTKRLTKQETRIHYTAAYVYDNITYDKFTLSIGARYTDFRRNNVTTVLAKNPNPAILYKQHALSPRAALTFMPDSTLTFYALFDQTFMPNRVGQIVTETVPGDKGLPRVNATKPVEPEKGDNFELGVKKNWFNGRLLTTLNGFHTIKRNVVGNDSGPYEDGLSYALQLAEIVSNGFEIDVIGKITDQLSLVTNYTYVDAKITKDYQSNTKPEESLVGQKMAGVPQHIFNTWIQYSFELKGLNRISISAGQTTIAKLTTLTATIPATYLPKYTKFDAGLSYTTPKYYARLIADNLTNKRYMSSGDTNPYPYLFVEGEPFNVKLSVGVKL